MNIQVLRKMEYEGYWIHIMHFGKIFQYLIATKKGEIFQHYISLPPSFIRLAKFKLGISKELFSTDEMELGEKIILSGAMATVDKLNETEEKATMEMKEASKIVNSLRKDKRCMWRALEVEGIKSYHCMNHDVVVPMEEGKIPAHDITKDTKVLSPLQFEENNNG